MKRWACEACGYTGGVRRGDEAPQDWGAAPVRCPNCVQTDRLPPPVTVRWLPRSSEVKREQIARTLLAEPDATNHSVACRLGVSSQLVSSVRAELVAAGVKPHRSFAEKRDAIDRALDAHPERTDKWLADELGVGATTVTARRRQREADGSLERLEQLLGRDGRSWAARREEAPA